MIPSAYEFHWDLGHLVFLGIFYTVVLVVAASVALAVRRWRRDLRQRRAAAIAWQETFHDLPDDRRRCRHDLDGADAGRLCDHGFDCGTCARHRACVDPAGHAAGAAVGDAPAPTGLGVSEDRLYHRGHTWVEPRADGTFAVGCDDLLLRCLGRPDHLEPPRVGSRLELGDPLASVQRGRCRTRILTPLAGTVVAVGSLEHGWLCHLRPDGPAPAVAHLLRGREAAVWMLRELESLQRSLSADPAQPVLADGGVPVDDLMQAYPDADWDGIWGRVCLDA
ncbi:MAG: hypothetical protein R3D98_02355 [Candidatus Krumholzibacteriia bacterium]